MLIDAEEVILAAAQFLHATQEKKCKSMKRKHPLLIALISDTRLL